MVGEAADHLIDGPLPAVAILNRVIPIPVKNKEATAFHLHPSPPKLVQTIQS